LLLVSLVDSLELRNVFGRYPLLSQEGGRGGSLAATFQECIPKRCGFGTTPSTRFARSHPSWLRRGHPPEYVTLILKSGT
jgi:hypothetical protein